MLRNGEALVQQKFQRVMICSHHNGERPKVYPPVVHCFDHPDELPLIGGQLVVLWCDGSTVEHDGIPILM
jgi:hypothetical protein